MIRILEFLFLVAVVFSAVFVLIKVLTVRATCNIYDQTHSIVCRSTKSKVCIDGLCAIHCHQIHGDRCLGKFL